MITGAWRGLGRNAAARLHERGASVAVNVREEDRANEVASALGPRALAVPGDITDPRVPTEIVSRTLDRFGRIDILVNNAAHARPTRFEQLDAEEWRLGLETNMTAPFLLMKAALPAMKARSLPALLVKARRCPGATLGQDGEGGLCESAAMSAVSV